MFNISYLYPFSPHPAMAKKKKNRAAVSTVSSAAVPSSAAGAELGSAVKAVQWLASGQGKSDGGVE